MILLILTCFTITCVSLCSAQTKDAGPEELFGPLKLVQEIDCSIQDNDLLFAEYPKAQSSEVADILGRSCRILKPDTESSKYFAYRVGEDSGLVPGKAYVLCVEFPEDVSRSMFVHNGGCETVSGIATGTATGDTIFGRYVNHNPESLNYPLSGTFRRWTGLFFLHDRFPEIKRPRGNAVRPLTPEEGFWVTIAVPKQELDPTSAGAAVSKITLYEVLDPEKLVLPLVELPDDLPRRHLFWREEMADGVIAIGHTPQEKDEKTRGVKNPVDWYEYKVRWMRFMGMDVFCKDLLEFGHNQGWDSSPHGGSAWINQSPTPELWENILKMLATYRMPILPYYEYAGSIGQDEKLSLGRQKRAKRLDGGDTFTHITWCEHANVDLSDPETLGDFKKILDDTIGKYKNLYTLKNGKEPFLGVWLRPRPSANPVSFNEKNIRQFSRDTNQPRRISRAHLQGDKELLQQYYAWWFERRREFLEGVRDDLREKITPDAVVLYTTDTSEPGYGIPDLLAGEGKKDSWTYKTNVVNDDMENWTNILEKDPYPKRYVKPVPIEDAVEKSWHLQAMKLWATTWGGWENHHAAPPTDPENYQKTPGVMLTHTIHRKYSVSDPKSFEAFRTPDGLTVVRHFPLNEHELNVGDEEPTGYFVADVERAGPFCVLPEVYAMAYGDPRFLGYLTGNSFQRGFPEYVRSFNAAFLAIPAVESRIVFDDPKQELVVREYKTQKHGTWYAVCHLGFEAKNISWDTKGVTFAQWKDCVSGETVRPNADGILSLNMEPCMLRAFKSE